MAPTAGLQKVCQETTFKFCSPFNFAQRWKFLSKAQFEFTHRHEVQQDLIQQDAEFVQQKKTPELNQTLKS